MAGPYPAEGRDARLAGLLGLTEDCMRLPALRLFALAAAIFCSFGCDDDDPCGRYVAYMCDCHADDPDFDCGELENAYIDADAAVQDECALELQDQKAADDDAGLQCDA
jgi:hypothetical protein